MNDLTPKISIRNLYKRFGRKEVLRGIDIDIMAGESVVIIGGSGTGKSVLLKCILGLLQPEQGSIKIDGEEMMGKSWKAREKNLRKIGMLFQSSALFDSLKVWENVAFRLLQTTKINRIEAKQAAVKNLQTVGLDAFVADLSPSELSGGMQKRVGLARAIATKPEIIFFDEPTTGLDPIMSDIINNLIIQTVKNLGATAVSITHDLISARKIAHRVVMLNEGKVVWQGPVEEMDHSQNEYITQFIHGRATGPIKMPGQLVSS